MNFSTHIDVTHNIQRVAAVAFLNFYSVSSFSSFHYITIQETIIRKHMVDMISLIYQTCFMIVKSLEKLIIIMTH